MAHRLVYVMGDVFIFDIDGCIMPNIFPLIKDTQMEDNRITQDILKKASNISLFPEFIEFYKQNCAKCLAVYFITGRKRKYYGKITESQLQPLKNYKNYIIKYFPDNKSHILNEYFQWKAKIIKNIMNQWSQDSARFHIYDDLEDLFPIIFEKISATSKDYKCKLIQEQGDWIHYINIES